MCDINLKIEQLIEWSEVCEQRGCLLTLTRDGVVVRGPHAGRYCVVSWIELEYLRFPEQAMAAAVARVMDFTR